MQTNDEIEKIIKSAFSPYEARTEFYDNNYKIRFKVFKDNGTPISGESKSPLRYLRDPSILKTFINSARQHIVDKGYNLDPWDFPEIREEK